ncbi:hypothetical protein AB4Y89_23690 [Terriglobus sp. 2YAB30_2]|uniref:hypothetical protein n=1 Tax=unclassified Terriglobus TaxID=2628988 RepID=UPI003F974BC8
MTLREWAVRIVRLTVAVALSLVLIATLALQIQQRTLRWRAERLSADMHQIRLYQSTWTDAQRLMHRWGGWGHYDGSCTAESCKYSIEMDSLAFYNPRVPRHAWLDWLLTHDRFNVYQWLGGRGAAFNASFTVHNGTIWRESTAIGVSVPGRRMRREGDFDLTLSIGAESYQRLHRTLENPFVYIGGAEDLAQHPYYKVGRPGGCMINCQIGVVYYSTHTPPAEIERLTSYDFSCFTRFAPCAELEDLLPAAKDWHLYKEDELKQHSLPEKTCDVPVWALARDARYVLAVEALSTKVVKEGGHDRELAEVRVVGSIKEPAPWLPDAIVSAYPNIATPQAEHLVPGRRYIVFPVGNDRRDQLVTKDSPLRFEPCGVREDTPEIRSELEKGFAQNDALHP